MSALPAVIEERPVAVDRPPFVEGIYTNDQLSNAEYHSIDALSSTGAKVLAQQSGFHYQFKLANPLEQTPSLRMGTAVHTGILEPHKFDAEIMAVPANAPKYPTDVQLNAANPSAKTLAAIDWWQDFEKRSEGKVVLKADEYDRVLKMIASVQRHDFAMAVLEDGQREYSILWRDREFDVPCRCRFDSLRLDDMVAADLKTCVDASPDAFARSAANLAYHLSAAFYHVGAETMLNQSPRAWFWVCVENVAPFATAVYRCEADALRAGMRMVNTAMGRYRVVRSSGFWDAYPGIKPLKFPRYALMHPNEE